MVNCKFNNLAPDENVFLDANPQYCYSCNWQDKYYGKAVYKGHGELNGIMYDVFEINFTCPSCGKIVNFYIEPCKSVSFSMELPLFMELPTVLKND